MAIDFVKGWCVIGMLIHHSWNYYPLEIPAVKYVRFVSGAFLFLSGFMITHHYGRRYNRDAQAVYLRLFTRACKLFVLFAVLNFIPMMVLGSPLHVSLLSTTGWREILYQWLLVGNYRLVNFGLLVPIVYVLIVVPVVLYLLRWRTPLLMGLALLLVLFGITPYATGPGAYYFRHFAIGVLGAAVGLVAPGRTELLAGLWRVILVSFVVYACVLPMISLSYWVYVLVTFLNVVFLYTWGLRTDTTRGLWPTIALLGRYSLVGYLVQIAILQVLRRLLPVNPDPVNFSISLTAATIGTVATIYAVDRLRNRSQFVRVLYNAVFA